MSTQASSHEQIVRELDDVESQVYSTYCAVARLRLKLQRQWRVLPDGARWTEVAHRATDYRDGAVNLAPVLERIAADNGEWSDGDGLRDGGPAFERVRAIAREALGKAEGKDL